jgi:hypothetical protein
MKFDECVVIDLLAVVMFTILAKPLRTEICDPDSKIAALERMRGCVRLGLRISPFSLKAAGSRTKLLTILEWLPKKRYKCFESFNRVG